MRENHHLTEDQDYLRARELRHNSSQFEQKLWTASRKIAAIEQLKFRRQQPIHPYIADFACMKAKLLIGWMEILTTTNKRKPMTKRAILI